MRTRRQVELVLLAPVVVLALLAGPAFGQGEPPPSSVPATTTTTSIVEPPPSTDAPTTTAGPQVTVPPDVSLPPTPPGVPPLLPGIDDELLEDLLDGAPSHYASQPPFDAATLQILQAPLLAARRRVALHRDRLMVAESLLVELTAQAVALEGRYHDLQDRRVDMVGEADDAQGALSERAVDAYLRGKDAGLDAILSAPDAAEAARRSTFVRSVLEEDELQLVLARGRVDDVTAELRRLVEARLDARRRHRKAQVQTMRVQAEVARAEFEVTVWETGSHVMVDGFTFPVESPTSFYDGWGDTRMPGTAWAHWHEGTDILAPSGTPLLAAEDGVISSVSSHILGGFSLWVDGNSGTRYYYAHLSAYEPGVGEGSEVQAGDVVGYVGDTGNARGTPHLHFEIHVDGSPVNPYPILRVAWEWRVRLAVLAGDEPPVVETGPIAGASMAPLPAG